MAHVESTHRAGDSTTTGCPAEEEVIPHHHNTSVWTKYKKGKLLGSGNFGDVFHGTHLETGAEVAVKVLKKGSIHRASAQKEIAVHAKAALHQSNTTEDTRLMRLQEVFVNASTRETSLIMELARGGDLFDRVSRSPYGEVAARKLLVMLVEAVIKLHSINIAHRDLKLENILLRKEEDQFDFVIADLGGAKWFPENERPVTSTETGTIGYTAPEAVRSNPREQLRYDPYQVDVFSLGVILYILLCGYPPWDLQYTPPRRRPKEIAFETKNALTKVWGNISEEAKDLIRKMLDPNPETRIAIEQVLSHDWIPPSELEELCPVAAPDSTQEVGTTESQVSEDLQSLTPDVSKGEILLEVYENQRLRLTQGMWGLPFRRKRWTDKHGSIVFSLDEELEAPPDRIYIPSQNQMAEGCSTSCCSVAEITGEPAAVVARSEPSAWQYSTSWNGTYTDCKSWRSFVRRRVFQLVALPENASCSISQEVSQEIECCAVSIPMGETTSATQSSAKDEAASDGDQEIAESGQPSRTNSLGVIDCVGLTTALQQEDSR